MSQQPAASLLWHQANIQRKSDNMAMHTALHMERTIVSYFLNNTRTFTLLWTLLLCPKAQAQRTAGSYLYSSVAMFGVCSEGCARGAESKAGYMAVLIDKTRQKHCMDRHHIPAKRQF